MLKLRSQHNWLGLPERVCLFWWSWLLVQYFLGFEQVSIVVFMEICGIRFVLFGVFDGWGHEGVCNQGRHHGRSFLLGILLDVIKDVL